MSEHTLFGLFIVTLLGFGWGSFATMATYRLPRNMPWIGDKPRCFKCKHELNIIDYLSVFSYFLWKGKCRYCKQKYECNLSYFFTEFAITAFFILSFLTYGLSDLFVLHTLTTVAFVVLAIIDTEHKKIPPKVLITLLMIGLVYRTFIDTTFYGALFSGISAGIAGLAIRHIYFALQNKNDIGFDYTKWQHHDRFIGPGFDYVKLTAIIGVFLPLHHIILLLTLTTTITIIWHFIHKQSVRLGTLMATISLIMIILPQIPDTSWQLLLQ